MEQTEHKAGHDGEQGFMLLGVIVLIFLVLLALSVAAPKVAQDLRRDREVEAIHRGNEYVRAIQLYYKKFGHYPGNMEQLEKSNNIRFLRQKYTDPMTGKADWRLIHVGEAKTTVKGFFGQPLAGLPGATAGGLGSAASMASAQPGQTVAGTTSASSASSAGTGSYGPMGGSMPGSSSPTTSGPTTSGPGGSSSPGSSSLGGSSSFGGIGSQSATSFTGGGGPIVGIGSSKTGTSITELNEQTTYQTWEFLYDPRIEQMKQKAALLGGGAGTGFGSSTVGTPVGTPLGGSPGGTTTPGSSSAPSSPSAPITPTTPQ
jgi:type II secretory pathway pseudopilin PulG